MSSPLTLNATNNTTTAWTMITGSDFDPWQAQKWMADNWHRSFYLAGAYLLFLRAGRRYMRDRAAFQLTQPLIIWNALLTAFSVVGSYYTLPEFISHYQKHGYFNSYCVVDDYYRRPLLGFWVWAFHFSKAPELGDTIFLILRKKPVTFLHVYHHTTVLLWCWFCYPYWSSPPRWGVCINYVVHACMYAYYTARAAGVRLPAVVAPTVTTMQLAQFLICVPLNAVALYRTYFADGDRLSETGSIIVDTQRADGCDTTWTLALWQQFLYNTYFVLFAHYFYKAYLCKRDKSQGLLKKEE